MQRQRSWRSILGLAVLTVIVASMSPVVRDARAEKAAEDDIRRELRELFAADQADRRNFESMSPEELRAMSKRDAERRIRVKTIVESGRLQAAEEYYHAAMALQHGDQPEDYLLAHELAIIAGFKGDRRGKWLSAASLDRFLHAIHRPQRFGTQYRRDGTGPWTQEPYDRSLPDAIRKEYSVPAQSEQGKTLETLNRSKS